MLIEVKGSPFWYYQFDYKGKTYKKTTKIKNDGKRSEKLALKVEESARKLVIENELNPGVTVILLPIILCEALNMYATSIQGAVKRAKAQSIIRRILGKVRNSDTTSETYRDVFGMLPTLPYRDLSTALVGQLVTHRQAEGLATQTILHELGVLQQTISWMDSYKEVKTHNPVNFKKIRTDFNLKITDEDRKTRIAGKAISLEDTNKLISDLSTFDKNPNWEGVRLDNLHLVVLLADTGARVSEILNMRWSQVQPDNKKVTIIRTKTDNSSVICATDRMQAVLEARRGVAGEGAVYVFQRDGKPIRYSLKGLQQSCKRAGIKRYTWHSFRHGFVTQALQAGSSLTDVAKIAGHKSDVTRLYDHSDGEEASARINLALSLKNPTK